MNNIKKNVLLSATALGLVFAFNANAAIDATDMEAIATSIETGYVAAPDLADYEYDKDGDGAPDTAIDGTTTSVDNAWYEFELSDGTTGNAGSVVTSSDARYTFTAQDDSSTSYDASSASINAANYSWTPTGGSATPLNDSDIAATELSKTGYTYTDWNGATQNISDGAPNPSNYAFTNSLGDSDSLANYFDSDGNLVLPAAEVSYASEAVSHYNTDKTNYNTKYGIWETDEESYLAATGKLDHDIEQLATNKQNYENDSAALMAAQGLRDTAQDSLDAVNSEYNTAKAASDAYDDSLGKAVDTKADNAINRALGDDGAVKTAMDGAVQQLADGAVADNTTAIATLNGDANTDGSVAHAIDQTVGHANTAGEGEESTATGLFKAVDDEVARAKGEEKAINAKIGEGFDDENTITKAIATLNGDENTDGSVAKAIAEEAAARNTAIAAATTMGDTDGKNYVANSSVIAAIESIDTNMGQIHGLVTSADATTTSNGKEYAGNLAVGTTVEDHLLALDSAIGDMRGFASQHYATDTSSVAANLTALDNQVYANAQAIGTTDDGTYVASANTVGQNLNALDTEMANVRADMASTQASNESRFNAIDHRISSLRNEMREGLAATAALAGLVPLDNTYKSQLSMAMGGYENKQAVALGGFHYLKDNIILNAGVSYGGSHSTAYKVGVTFGF